MLKMVKSRVNLFIAVSEAVKNSLVSAGVDAVRITVLQNFVDTKKFNPYKSISVRESFRALYKIDQNDFVFGFAGRIIERKGWFEFVTAAKDVIDVNPTAKFFVAGDGPEMKQMKTLISQLNIDDNFVCPGKIKDIKLFYSAIDVFVLSSYWEGMPMVQLEAFAMGVPLVSSNGPGMNELAVDNVSCLYVPIKDSAALSKQLISLMNDEELLKKLSNEGFEISNKHSLDNYLSKLWFIYNSL
jgi:glycosyltransferase involved in cell wall biosynthesis